MNNEEKILAMLTEIKEDVANLRADMTNGKEDISVLKADVAEVQASVKRVSIIQENIVLNRMDSLADGQKNLRRLMAPASKISEMGDEISVIKSVVQSHSSRLAALEKAQ